MRALVIFAGLVAASLAITACSDESNDPRFTDGDPTIVDENGAVVVNEEDALACPDDSIDARCRPAPIAPAEKPRPIAPS